MNAYVARSGRILRAWAIAFAIVVLAVGALSTRLLSFAHEFLATQLVGHVYQFGGPRWTEADRWPYVYAFVIELVLAAGYVATGRAWTRWAFRIWLAMRMVSVYFMVLMAYPPT